MKKSRILDPVFTELLERKDGKTIELFYDLRNFLLEAYPAANELLYHTHALTCVFTLSDKLADAYCMIPVYTKHLHLGFNKGTRLTDTKGLLKGTGHLIRHIPINEKEDYRNASVKKLVQSAIEFSIKDMEKKPMITGQVISKIKK